MGADRRGGFREARLHPHIPKSLSPGEPALPDGGPWLRNGWYWSDQGYDQDLERAVAYVCQQTGCPNLANFLRAQSHEETGYGRLFTSINNFWNMGAIDSNPQAAARYMTPEAGGQGWLDFLGWSNPRSTYARFKLLAQEGIEDVYALAAAIKAGGWATDPTYAQDVASKL